MPVDDGLEIPLNASEIYARLLSQEPSIMPDLPRDQRGIYMLWDHEGVPRYIGIVDKESFHKRIDGRHRGGREENSHKFSAAYNTGRMWRDRKRLDEIIDGVQQAQRGAAAAKRVRMAFIRRYCRATFVRIEAPAGEHFGTYVRQAEAAVQRLARPEHRSWETQARIRLVEPVELVDSVIDELLANEQLTTTDLALLENQKRLHAMTCLAVAYGIPYVDHQHTRHAEPCLDR